MVIFGRGQMFAEGNCPVVVLVECMSPWIDEKKLACAAGAQAGGCRYAYIGTGGGAAPDRSLRFV